MLRARAVLAFALLAAFGCAGAPPLDPHERFEVSSRRGGEAECIMKVKALFDPPFPAAPILRGNVSLAEGKVTVEVAGWKSRPDYPGEEPAMVEVKVGFRPETPFVFALLYLGHRDEYTVVVSAAGEPRVDPASGEFSLRGAESLERR
jgi:hypothetical protein